MRHVVLTAAALIVSTSAGADRDPVRMANDFAAAYNVWTQAANQHHPGQLDLNERKAWQRVKSSFKTLDSSLNRWR